MIQFAGFSVFSCSADTGERRTRAFYISQASCGSALTSRNPNTHGAMGRVLLPSARVIYGVTVPAIVIGDHRLLSAYPCSQDVVAGLFGTQPCCTCMCERLSAETEILGDLREHAADRTGKEVEVTGVRGSQASVQEAEDPIAEPTDIEKDLQTGSVGEGARNSSDLVTEELHVGGPDVAEVRVVLRGLIRGHDDQPFDERPVNTARGI